MAADMRATEGRSATTGTPNSLGNTTSRNANIITSNPLSGIGNTTRRNPRVNNSSNDSIRTSNPLRGKGNTTRRNPTNKIDSPLWDALHAFDIAKIKKIIEGGGYIEEIDENGTTPLTWVCNIEYVDTDRQIDEKVIVELVKMLIEKGADINAVNVYGMSALTGIIINLRERPSTYEIALDLIEKGADVNERYTDPEKKSQGFGGPIYDLLYFIRPETNSTLDMLTKYKDLMLKLIEAGANIKDSDNQGIKTPLLDLFSDASGP
jgi:ankyrin repeat protein